MKLRVAAACALAGLALLTGWTAACESGSRNAPAGPSVVAPTTLTVTIGGNLRLQAVGETSQLIAEALYADGSKKDVSATAQWFTSNRSVATAATGGLITATGFGKTSVWANAEGKSAGQREIVVLPDGAYILSGRITEAANLVLAGARVQIVGGPMDGQTTTTGQTGWYSFVPVTGAAQVQASKDGYVTASRAIPRETEQAHVELAPSVPYASVAGAYRLAFKASASCQLPDDALSREYTATLSQTAAGVTVTLSDAQFGTRFGRSWNSFSGRMYGNTVSFILNDWYYAVYSGGLAEKLSEGRYLMLTGTAEAAVTGSLITAAFAGSANIIASPDKAWESSVACSAADHQLVFTRTR